MAIEQKTTTPAVSGMSIQDILKKYAPWVIVAVVAYKIAMKK